MQVLHGLAYTLVGCYKMCVSQGQQVATRITLVHMYLLPPGGLFKQQRIGDAEVMDKVFFSYNGIVPG